MLLNRFFRLFFLVVLLHLSCLHREANNCSVEENRNYINAISKSYGVDNPACVKHLLRYREYCEKCPCTYHEVASSLLNLGSIYFEEFQHKDSSLIFLDEASSLYRARNDTLGYANILKYIGWVLADGGRIDGIDSIRKAKEFYSNHGDNNGIAVCDRNLALAYVGFEKYEQAKVHFLEAMQHWVDIGSSSRVTLLYQDYMSSCELRTESLCPLRTKELDSLFSKYGSVVESQ